MWKNSKPDFAHNAYYFLCLLRAVNDTYLFILWLELLTLHSFTLFFLKKRILLYDFTVVWTIKKLLFCKQTDEIVLFDYLPVFIFGLPGVTISLRVSILYVFEPNNSCDDTLLITSLFVLSTIWYELVHFLEPRWTKNLWHSDLR